MNVDMDGGASGNINMEPSSQSNEQNEEPKKIKLSELPKEILEQILVDLDDKDLLNASHVCKSLESAAEMAFAQKYAMEWYAIYNTEKEFHKVMLNKYGGRMRWLEIANDFDDDGDDLRDDAEILDLVERKCCNAEGLKLYNYFAVLKNLRVVEFGLYYNVKKRTFAEFFKLNPQLESLEFYFSRVPDLPAIRLDSLETLSLGMESTANCVRVLESINCNQIKELELHNIVRDSDDDVDDFINEICKFKKLVSLDLNQYRLTLNEVEKLAARLRRLTKFHVGLVDGDSKLVENTASIKSMFPKLSKLQVRLEKDELLRLLDVLKSSANDFHARYAQSNTVIELSTTLNTIIITTDYLYLRTYMSGNNCVELHWMDNLNKKGVRKVLNSFLWRRVEMKFVNNCADCTFDISALANSYTNCLDFKSNGPICVKSNALHYHTWFPRLKTLKIHLEQDSANDFLQNLEANFCEQIEELWLNTKVDAEDPDMTNVLAKFSKLKSLHLAPSFVNKCDLSHLSSLCRDLDEIKFIRQ